MTDAIKAIQAELRDAIFWTLFHIQAAKINRIELYIHSGRQKAIGFVEFGVRCKLITPEEGNDWLDVVWNRKSSAEVSDKWARGEQKEQAMTDAKRDALRALQDRWLQISTVQAQIRNYGLDHCIGGVGTPTFRSVQDCVLPEWETFFRGFFEE